MPLQLSHSCLLPLASLNKYTTSQIFDKKSNTFPKGNIQVTQNLDIDNFLNIPLYDSQCIRFCNSCKAIKDTQILNKKWYCSYCNDVNYDTSNENDSITDQDFYSNISFGENSSYSTLASIHLFILDYCINDEIDLNFVHIFNENLQNVLKKDDLINFVFIFPDGKFYTIDEDQKIISFDSKSNINFLHCAQYAKNFNWSLLKSIESNCILKNNSKSRVKRQLPLDVIYNHVSKLSNVFIKCLYHQLGPVTSKNGKIVNKDKKHLLRKFDDNKFNRESYKLSKTAYKYYKKQQANWSELNKKNLFINFSLFGCSLDDIGVMELSPFFRLYNFVDSYDSSINLNKLIYALQKWHYEDGFKIIEFESFSSSELFNISGIWGEPKNYQKMIKSQRNYNKKPIDDLYVKNLVKTDHCKILSTNSLYNIINMSYNLKLVRDTATSEDGVITEEMLQLKSGIKPRRLELYPESIRLQTILKFIHNGVFYLHRSNRILPVTTDLDNLTIDHKMLLAGIIKKFVLTATPLIINDIHNISIYMEQYQATLTTQLIRDYLKIGFLRCLDTDLETFLHAIFNMKYVLPITNLVQLTPDEFIINCFKLLGFSDNDIMLEILPKREISGSNQLVELPDCLYLISTTDDGQEELSFNSKKPVLLINNDSVGRYLSNKLNFQVVDNDHQLLVDLEKFKGDMINKSSLKN